VGVMEFGELWSLGSYGVWGVWGSANVKYYKWHKYQDSSVIENGKFFIDGFSGRIKILLSEKCKN